MVQQNISLTLRLLLKLEKGHHQHPSLDYQEDNMDKKKLDNQVIPAYREIPAQSQLGVVGVEHHRHPIRNLDLACSATLPSFDVELCETLHVDFGTKPKNG